MIQWTFQGYPPQDSKQLGGGDARPSVFNSFYRFWLPNRPLATTGCNFSTIMSPDPSAPAALPSLYLSTHTRRKTLEKNIMVYNIPTSVRMDPLSSQLFPFLSSRRLCMAVFALTDETATFVHTLEVWLLNFLQSMLIESMCFLFLHVVFPSPPPKDRDELKANGEPTANWFSLFFLTFSLFSPFVFLVFWRVFLILLTLSLFSFGFPHSPISPFVFASLVHVVHCCCCSSCSCCCCYCCCWREAS